MKKENMTFKTLDLQVSDDIEGKVEAVFSVFNTVDSDEDVVLPNSIKSAWGDKGVPMVWSHDWKDVIGRGEIVQDEEKAVFKGQFIMDTERGRDALEDLLELANQSQHPRAYEVVGQLIKTLTDTNEKIVDIQAKAKDILSDPKKAGPDKVTNNLFVGTNADLTKLLGGNARSQLLDEPKK